MIGVLRFSDSAIEQFVFFCEKVSVAAAKREISVVLPTLVDTGFVETIVLGLEGDLVGP